MKRSILILAAILSFRIVDVNAASLFGRVIEVNSGDVITIFNLNRPVRVRLLGVDAPEMDQAFGDVAKKHLSDLIYDKSVLVEYSGIGADRSLTGRVLLNEIDIGAQMIRDGAAWCDLNNVSRLSETAREVYRQSEQAARSERRGLWQAENPTAPWDFVKAEAGRKNSRAGLKSIFPSTEPRSDRPVPELTNLTLMTFHSELSRGASTEMDPGMRWYRAASTDWVRLRPAGERFTAMVPDDGEQVTLRGTSEFPLYVGRDGWSRYAVSWMTLQTSGERDRVAIRGILQNVLTGFGQSYRKVGASRGLDVAFGCDLDDEKDVSGYGFTGGEFDLKTCTIPGRARVYTRIVGNQRLAYIAVAFYMEEDPNVMRFINSFVLTEVPNGTKQKRTGSSR